MVFIQLASLLLIAAPLTGNHSIMKSRISQVLELVVLLTLADFEHKALAAEQVATPKFHFKIEFATLIGGSEYDDLREIIVLPDGSLLLGGQTVSADFPVTDGVVQSKYGGEPAGSGHPGLYGGDCCLALLSADGSRILAATYFGGSKQERDVYGMTVDRQGNIVITTATRSLDLPTTEGAFQRHYGGGEADVVVAKLSGDLKRVVWCTYLGGSGNESPRGGLDMDASGNIYVVGNTKSPNFPTTSGVFGPKWKGNEDAFVAKLKSDGSGLVWSTLLGGKAWDGIMGARVDNQGRVYVAGHTQSEDFPITPGAAQASLAGKSDSFLAAFSADASQLLYSTYLGGSGNEFAEHRLALLKDGGVLLTGTTASKDFPITPKAFQRELRGKNSGFVAKLSAGGRRLTFSTLVDPSGEGFFLMPTTDDAGNIYFVGRAASPNFPTTTGALQPEYGGKDDGVFGILSPDGTKLLYATYLGGKEEELLRSLAISPNGDVYLIGKTASDDFPVTRGAAQSKRKGKPDAFVVKLARVP